MDLNVLLSGKVADVKVDWEGEVVRVMYDKHAYTPKLEADVMHAADTGGGESLANLLSSLVTDWDIVDKGSSFPVTRDNLGMLPVSFLVQVMKSIAEAMQADPLLSGNSDVPS